MYVPLTHQDVNERTRDRILDLEEQGFKTHLVWEHEILNLLKSSEGFQQIWNDKELWQAYSDPINPRSALTGGRTEPICALLELSEQQIAAGYTMEHLDITRYPEDCLYCMLDFTSLLAPQ